MTPITRTVSVVTRHAADCPDKKRGPDYRRCHCRKSLVVYEDGRVNRISAKTRSWEKAEKFAQEYRDSFDPEKQELKKLRASKERAQVRIESAVAGYIADMIARLGDRGTVAMARSLFGNIDPETKAVKKNGHLFDYFDSLPAPDRPAFISEISPAILTGWRASWKFGSDLTVANRWSMIRGFFNFCESQGWVADNPSRKLRRPAVARGSRTAIFTDQQYADILDSVASYDPENIPAATRKSLQQRLTTFIELLRWTGMALVDAVQFRPELVDDEGVLRYRRQKTGELATVALPDHLLPLLRSIPLEQDCIGVDQPFRTGAKLASDTAIWARRLRMVFALADIKEVRTDGRVRKPHAHMLRDTFAVWNLRHGASLHAVSKMVGHSNPSTTARAYLPWVKELETATIAESRKALAAGLKPVKGRKVVSMRKKA